MLKVYTIRGTFDKKVKKCFLKEGKEESTMIQIKKSKGVIILTFDTPPMQTEPSILLVKGKLLDALLGEIDKQYNQNCRKLLINLTNVAKIDEEAFAELLGKGSKDGIRICFFDMQRSVRNILKDVPTLSLVFDVYGSEEAAIASFGFN